MEAPVSVAYDGAMDANGDERHSEELRRLIEEQTALRRLATLVGEGASEVDLIATITSEMGRLFEAADREHDALGGRHHPRYRRLVRAGDADGLHGPRLRLRRRHDHGAHRQLGHACPDRLGRRPQHRLREGALGRARHPCLDRCADHRGREGLGRDRRLAHLARGPVPARRRAPARQLRRPRCSGDRELRGAARGCGAARGAGCAAARGDARRGGAPAAGGAGCRHPRGRRALEREESCTSYPGRACTTRSWWSHAGATAWSRRSRAERVYHPEPGGATLRVLETGFPTRTTESSPELGLGA